MKENSGGHERSSLELILFGIIFCGVGLEIVGVITASKAAAVTGVVLIAFGLFYFFVAGLGED